MVENGRTTQSPPSGWDFHAFFARKYWRLLGSALNRAEKTNRFETDEQVLALRALYDGQLAQHKQANRSTSQLPKTIWMLWQQGWNDAPELVQRCAQSWRDLNPGWDVRTLSQADVLDLAPEYATVTVPDKIRTASSNIARLALLKKFGGVWADATLFCQQPLDDWLPHVMSSGFFMFHQPRPYRYSDIWFLAGVAHSPALERWFDLSAEYWKHVRIPHHYYWMEYLFEYLCERDPEIAEIWENTPKLTALPALMSGRDPFNAQVCAEMLQAIEAKAFPVHKLSHKWSAPEGDFTGSPLHTLTGISTYG